MSVDQATVRRIAKLARIKVPEAEVAGLQGELNAILAFVETLGEVDVAGVEPMTSVMPMPMKKRVDEVTDGEIADLVTRNAPASEDHFFVVPKVIDLSSLGPILLSLAGEGGPAKRGRMRGPTAARPTHVQAATPSSDPTSSGHLLRKREKESAPRAPI